MGNMWTGFDRYGAEIVCTCKYLIFPHKLPFINQNYSTNFQFSSMYIQGVPEKRGIKNFSPEIAPIFPINPI